MISIASSIAAWHIIVPHIPIFASAIMGTSALEVARASQLLASNKYCMSRQPYLAPPNAHYTPPLLLRGHMVMCAKIARPVDWASGGP